MKLKQYWKELQRRHVVKAGIAYLVVAWLLVQVLDILLDAFQLGTGWMQTAIIVLSVGFPIWLILAWIYDFSWGGIQKTEDIPHDSETFDRKNTNLNRLIIGGLSIAVILLIVNTLRISNALNLDEENKLSLAVLPFDNFSPDPNKEWLGDGFTEDIIISLGKLEEFSVIPRSSVMQYKNLDHTIPAIAKALDVSHIVDGSIRQDGDEILVTVHLVNKRNEIIWNGKFRKSTGNILDIQSDVAARVTEELLGELTDTNVKMIQTDQQIDPEAQKYLALGNRLYDQLSSINALEALANYEKALAIEPEWYEAINAVAYILKWSDLARADSLAQKAFSINPTSDKATTVKAWVLFLENKLDEAEEVLLQSISLDRDAPFSHDLLAAYYLYWNVNYEKALFHAKEALKIDPLNVWFIRRQIFALIFMERLEEAERVIDLKRPFLSKELLRALRRNKVDIMAEAASRDARDFQKTIAMYQMNLDTMPSEKGFYLMRLAQAYNWYYNDNKKFLEYAQKAWEERETVADTPTDGIPQITRLLVEALLENGKIAACRNIMDSDEFHRVSQTKGMGNSAADHIAIMEWNYHMAKADYRAATQWTRGDIEKQILIDAKSGHTTKVWQDLQKRAYSKPTLRARVFAIVGEPDSLFYYLKQEKINAPFVNSNPDFDPYRKDPRFIDFRKKHYLQDVSIE